MSKYKVGDKVILEAEITDVKSYVGRNVEVKFKDNGIKCIAEDYLIDYSKIYEQGLNDAWELAKKLYNLDCNTLEDIYGVDGGFYGLMKKYTAEEALAKIETHEESKEQLKRFDVVEAPSGILYYVSHIEDNDNGSPIKYHYVGLDKGFTLTSSVKFKKTGKHLDIEYLLEQIRGGTSSERNNSKRND